MTEAAPPRERRQIAQLLDELERAITDLETTGIGIVQRLNPIIKQDEGSGMFLENHPTEGEAKAAEELCEIARIIRIFGLRITGVIKQLDALDKLVQL